MYFEGHYEDSFGTQMIFSTEPGEPFEHKVSTTKKLIFEQVKVTRKFQPVTSGPIEQLN
jgi:hypothetical protein